MSSDGDTSRSDFEDIESEDTSTDSDGYMSRRLDKNDEKPLHLIKFQNSSGIESPFQISINDFALNELTKKCLNHKICSICITGHRRSGKSVLANFLLHRLRNLKSNRKNWTIEVRKLSGFQFTHGYKSNTEGIWVWSDPIMVETDDETIAVIVMETQGLDDELSSTEAKLAMMGIPLLLSSLMIVNLIDDTVEDLTEWLYPFFNYHSSKSISGFDPPQKLSVLIRDWTKMSQFGFGEKGGGKLLKERQKQNKELEKYITLFQDSNCFLLHHIGERAMRKNFLGNSGDIDREFSSGLAKYINALLDPDILPVKTFFDNPVTFPEFKHFLVGYHDLLNQMFQDDCFVVQPENIFKISLEAAFNIKMSRALDQLRNTFQRQAKQTATKHLRESTIETIFIGARKKCLHSFREFLVPKSEEKNLEIRFEKELLVEKENIKKLNDDSWKKVVNDKLQNTVDVFSAFLQSEYPLSSHFDDAKVIVFYDHEILPQNLSLQAKKIIENFLQTFEDEEDTKVNELRDLINTKIRTLTSSHLDLNKQCYLKAAERANNEITGLLKKYDKKMNEHQECQDDVKVEDLRMFHRSTVKKIERKFNECRQISPGLKERFWTILKNKIEQNLKKRESRLVLASGNTNVLDFFNKTGSLKQEYDYPEMEHQPTKDFSLESRKTSDLQLSSQQTNLEHKIESIREHRMKAFETEGQLDILRFEFEGPTQLERYLLETEARHLEHFDMAFDFSEKTSNSFLNNRNKLEVHIAKFQNHIRGSEDIYRQCTNELISRMTKAVADACEYETLLEEHRKHKSEVIRLFKDRCSRNNESLFQAYQHKIEKKSEESLAEIKEIFDMKSTAKNAKIVAAKLEAKMSYLREMDLRFQNCPNGYFTNDELSKFHKHAASGVVKTVTRDSGLSEHQSSEIGEYLKTLYEDFWKKNNLMEQSHHDVEPAIGIDLGTTYCCMGVFLNGKVQILRSSSGFYTTPSYVTIHEDGSSVIGETSKNLAFKYPGCTIFDTKRIIGRQVDDEELQTDLKFWPFTVVLNNNMAQIKVHEKMYDPEEITSILLKHLREEAEKTLNLSISKAVITVPAYFTDGQRTATIKAGELAGIKVLGILNEPSAAAIAYRHEFFREKTSTNILVYDLGGGTFDVAVLKMSKHDIEVLSTHGDAHLGGEDFDKNMMNFCAQQFHDEFGIDISKGKDSDIQVEKDFARRRLRRLQSQCEIGKKELATALSTTISIAAFMEGEDLVVEISRDQFEEINGTYFHKTIEIVEEALKSANIRKDQIQEIILNGGSSRIPKLQAMLESYFNEKALNHKINPDEAVAYGAAIHAAMLNAKPNSKPFDFGMIQEVTPMSLGIQTINDEFDIIIPKNSKIPVEKTEEYLTSSDGQTSVSIVIYQGENEIASENKFLGKFLLGGIPPGKAKAAKVHVTIKINQNGILTVEAASLHAKKAIQITVNEERGGVCKKPKERLLESVSYFLKLFFDILA